MARQSPIQTNFTAGEISPRLIGRTDIAKYKNGCRRLKNFKVLPHGGVTKRAGLRFAARVKDSTRLARCIPFVFSTEQAYQLEIGDESIRAFTLGAQLAEGGRIRDPSFDVGMGGWSKVVNGGSVTWTAGYVTLDNGTVGGHYAEIRYAVALPYVAQTFSWTLNFPGATETVTIRAGTTPGGSELGSTTQSASGAGSLAFTPTTLRTYLTFRIAYGSANRTVRVEQANVQATSLAVHELPSPYADLDIFGLKYAQSADTLYLFHPDYPTYKVQRYGATQWDIIPVDWVDGPYLDENLTAITIAPSATTGNITLTASDDTFKPGHVEAYWRLTHGATTGYVKITGYTSAKVVSAEVKKTLGGTGAVTTWSEGAWSDERGFPSCGGFYEQRLFAGATRYQPAHFWGSHSGDYENMTPGTTDDEAVVYEIAEGQVNAIRWLSPSHFLLAGTTDGEHRIGQEDVSITPTNIQARPQTAHGAADTQPVQIGGITVFVQRARRKLRELAYSFEDAAYSAPDLSIIAEHITRPGIVEIAYQQEPDSIVWAVRDDGAALGMTYERAQEVVAWHEHETDGEVESVSVIPVEDGDQVWMIVKRTVNGSDYRSVEYLTREWEEGDSIEDAFYVDSGIVYSGAATTTITGLSHLEGKSVSVLANGSVHPPKTVSGGQITLDYSATKAIVGLPYTSTLETLPPPVNVPVGSGQAKPKRWAEIAARLHNTMGLKVNGREVPFRSSEDLMDTPVPFYSGWVNVANLGFDLDASVVYEHDLPTPCTILVQSGTLDVGDD